MTALDLFRRIAADARPVQPDIADRILAVATLPPIADRLDTCADQLTGTINADALDKCDLRGLAMELRALADEARASAGENAADRHLARARKLFGGGKC